MDLKILALVLNLGYEMFRVNILSAVLKVQDPQKRLYIHSEGSEEIGHGMPQLDVKSEMPKLTSSHGLVYRVQRVRTEV